MLPVVGRMLALCTALLVLAGAFVTSLTLFSSVDRRDDSHEVQQPGVAESTDQRESSPTDRPGETAAEDIEALAARHAPTEGLRRLTDLESSPAQNIERWLKIETPPPRA